MRKNKGYKGGKGKGGNRTPTSYQPRGQGLSYEEKAQVDAYIEEMKARKEIEDEEHRRTIRKRLKTEAPRKCLHKT